MSAGWQMMSAQQQLGNGGFETWNNVGSGTERPTNWSGIKSGQGSSALIFFAPQSIQRSTDTRGNAGNQYSARVYSSEPISGTIANGNLTIGRVNVGSSTPADPSNYNISVIADANYSEAFTSWPDSIVFWAKYTNSNAANKARVKAVIHDNYAYRDPSDAAAVPHAVGNAELNFTSTGGQWKRFAVPFNYTGPATTPAFILVTFTSNETPGGGNATDVVFVDDVEMIYNPVTTTASAISPLVYNVSGTQGTAISIPFTKTGIFHLGNVFTAQLSDASGSFASPVTLGTLTSSNAGTINGTIPAGTPSGTGYRVRVIASSPYQTATPNVSNITINLIGSNVTPVSAQTIAANTNGTTLTVNESVTMDSRVWKFATAMAGPYGNFTPSQTGTTYTPNFANAGTYYILCESALGSLTTESNIITVTVVKNQVTPAGTQSLITGVTGSTLTVTETPAGQSREWKFSTTAGGPYNAFAPAQTGTTYDPVFNTTGTYYVVCQSDINGVSAMSNEVIISVGSVNITTGTITGSPFEFSASAPDATVSVPYTVSNAFGAGNVFTAELSDANGSFASATQIGSVTATTDGTINATIPATTPAGTGYLIRVVGSTPAVLGSDNGTALTVDQYNNNLTPAAAQTFVYTATGTQLTVNESQNTTSREWRMGSVAGGPYSAIAPAQTGTTYTPGVASPGTYYVVCASTNQHGDEVISNEVVLNAQNGTTLATSAIAGSPFYVSPSANNAVNVAFTSDIAFNNGNVFTAQLSNASGSFAIPVTIGTLTSQTPGTIAATLPNVVLDGTGYRIRVISSDPAVNGTDNGTNLSMVNFGVTAAPLDTQYVTEGAPVSPVTLQSTHPGVTVEWRYRTSVIGTYMSFTPPVTGTTFNHVFPLENIYQVIGRATNNWGDTLNSDQVVFVVTTSGIEENASAGASVKAYMNNENFIVDLTASDFKNPQIQIINMAGQLVYSGTLKGNSVHTLPLTLASGIYTYNISENGKSAIGKIPVR